MISDRGTIMSPKLTFTIGSAITFLFSAAFFIAPEFFTMTAFPAAKGFAIDVGITMRYVLAATIFGVCCLLFQARNIESEGDQKSILLGAAIGFTIVCVTIVYATTFRELSGSIPPIIATGLMAILNWLSWAKIKV